MAEQTEAITARYDDRDQAGRAVERLSAQGIEAGRIHVLAPDRSTDRASHRATDKGTSRRLGRRFLIGIGIGVVVGAAFGAIVVALVTGAGWSGALAGAFGGATVGAGVGALTGLQSTPTMSRAWEDTFAPGQSGAVTLAVEIRDDRAGGHHSPDEVEAALAGTGAREIRRVHDLAGLHHEQDGRTP